MDFEIDDIDAHIIDGERYPIELLVDGELAAKLNTDELSGVVEYDFYRGENVDIASNDADEIFFGRNYDDTYTLRDSHCDIPVTMAKDQWRELYDRVVDAMEMTPHVNELHEWLEETAGVGEYHVRSGMKHSVTGVYNWVSFGFEMGDSCYDDDGGIDFIEAPIDDVLTVAVDETHDSDVYVSATAYDEMISELADSE